MNKKTCVVKDLTARLVITTVLCFDLISKFIVIVFLLVLTLLPRTFCILK